MKVSYLYECTQYLKFILVILLIIAFLSGKDSYADQANIISVLSKGDTLDWFGAHIEPAGDMNNDGYDDVWIWAKQESYNDQQTLTYYLYYGGNPMDTIPDYTIKDSITTIVNVGDMNLDGFDDFVIPHDGSTKYFGLYWGGPAFDYIPEFRFPVSNPDDIIFGRPHSICGGLDMDGDSIPDLVIGEPGYKNSFSGKAYYYGSKPVFDSLYDFVFVGKGIFPDHINFGFSIKCIPNLDGDDYLCINEGGSDITQTDGHDIYINWRMFTTR